MSVQITVVNRITIDAPEYGESVSMSEIERLADRAGSHYFAPGTMRFYRSRVDWHVYPGKDGWYFVTSEQFRAFDGTTKSRMYSVRKFHYSADATGVLTDVDIDTVGEFQAYPTLTRARTAARKAARASA